MVLLHNSTRFNPLPLEVVVKEFIYSWQYNGVTAFEEIISWCQRNFKDVGTWLYTLDTIYFTNEKEYVMFLLRWA